MARIIRYYERGEWKYATVKDIGEIEQLMTANKTDIVSAINELYQNGGASNIPPDLQEKIQRLEDLTSQHSGSIDGIYTDITNISSQQNLDSSQIQALAIKEEQLRLEMESTKNDLLSKASQDYVNAELATRVTGAELTTELSQKAGLSYVDGELAKKLTESKYQQEYLATQASIAEKLSLTRYQQEYDEIVSDISSKADISEFEGVKGRVTNVETSITNINGELEQKVSSVDYESDVGINKWLVTRFTGLISDMAQSTPEYALLVDATEQETVELLDVARMLPEASDATVYRFFTNVYMKQSKVVSLNLSYQDSVHVLMNGASIYKNKSNSGVGVVASLSLRKGWNTVEILLGNKDGLPSIDFGSTLSTLVDKMTTVIGVGDKNEFRLKRAETSIKQNSDQIALSATKTEVSNLGNRVESAEAELVIQAGQIQSKVGQETFDNYSQRLSTAESTITQQAGLIASKVEQTEFNLLNGKVSNQETEITQMSGEIALKASQSDVDALTGEVEEAKASLTVQAGQIATKVEGSTLTTELAKKEGSIPKSNTAPANPSIGQMWLDTSGTVNVMKSWTGTIWKKATPTTANEVGAYTKSETDGKITPLTTRLTSAETEITQTKEQIELKATKEEVDAVKTDVGDLVTRVSTAETAITQNSDEIALRATKTELNGLSGEVSTVKSQLSVQAGQISTKVEGSTLTTELAKKEGSIPKSNTAPANPTIGQMWLDTSTTVNQLKRWTGTTWAKSAPTTASEVGAYTKSETDGKTATALSDAKGYTDGQVAPVISRLTSAETAITQTQSEIALKATKTDVYTRTETDTKVGTKADQASLNTTNSNLSAVTTRVTQAEADIKVNADGIALRATKSDLDSLTNRVSTAESSLTVQSGQIATKVAQNDFNTLTNRVSTAESSITQQAGQIALRVEKAGIVSAINQTAETIKISASKIDIEGAVTFSSFDSSTQTKINTIENTADTAKTTATTAQSTATTANTTANTAKSTADTAKSTADTASSNATTALSRTNDMFDDLKVTPLEKQELKRLWDSIKLEYTQIIAIATSLAVTATNYTNAFNALNSTAPRIETDILASMSATYSFGTATNRDAFNGQLNTYFTQREALRKALSDKQKSIADGAQSTATTANTTATTAKSTADTAKSTADTAKSTADTAQSTATTANTTANTAKATAETASSNATTALGRTNDMFDDLKVTPPEKQELKRLWDSIKLEYTQIIAMATSLSVSATNYTSAFNALNTTAPRIETDVLASMTTTYSFGTTTNRDAFNTQLTNYFTQREALRKALSDKQKSIADGAQSTATSANTLAGTAKSTADTAKSTADTAQSTATTANTNATTAKTTADTAKSTADTAKATAETASSNATSALSKANDLYSDLKITPLEKQELKRLWDSIKLEYAQLIAMASSLSVSSTSYTTSYTALNSTAPRIETDILANLATTYDLVNATNRDAFKNQLTNYFTQREALKKALSDKQKTLADNAQDKADSAFTGADTALEVAKAMAVGKLVFEDVKFQDGTNGVGLYNNASNGAVTVTRIAKPADAPTVSTHALKITHTGAGSPGYGGFVQGINSRANAKFVVRYLINLPVGYQLATASNSMGTGYKDKLLGSVDGTGKYTEYIRVVECGKDGTFSGGGHIYVTGVTGTPTPTTTTPLEWYLASIELYDITDWEPVPSGVTQSIKSAQDDATDALSKTTEMFSDLKITPLEKQELKRLWDSIKIEYPQMIAMGTALSVSSSSYTTAYNALNGTSPRIETDVLASMNTTYTLTTTTRDTFDTQMKNYVTQREALRKAITDKQKTIADGAQSTATSANTLAGTANSTANTAKGRTDEMYSDLKITPLEKQELKRLWDAIKLEYTQNLAMGTALSVATSSYTTAYNALNSTAPRIETDVLASMNTTYDLVSTTNRDLFRNQMNAYVTQREALKKLISDKQKKLADDAQSTATTANGTANTAKGKTDELYSDLKITPLEKQELKRLWDAIKLEYTQNLAMGSALAVSTSSYTTAYNALNGTAPRIETDVLANMTTTYDLVNTTNRDSFRNQMNAYVTQREALKKALTDKQKSLTTTAQGTANDANTLAGTINRLTQAWLHPLDKTVIDGGKIYTNSITSKEIGVTSLSAISANIGTVNAGTISGVSFSSKPIKVDDLAGREWTQKTDIGVDAVGFRTTAVMTLADNEGKSAEQETSVNHSGIMLTQRDDKTGLQSFTSISGRSIQFGGATSNLVAVGQHFINSDGEFSLNSSNRMMIESFKDDVIVQGVRFKSGGVIQSEVRKSPVLLNGYTQYAGFTWASYYKDPDGIVHVTGLVRTGNNAQGTDIFVLPEGYRPSGTELFYTHAATAGGVRIDVYNSGTVKLQSGGAGSFISFAGISFKAEA